MNLSNLIANIHWLPVLVLTVFSFLLGFSWHRPKPFGNIWKRENYGEKDPPRINAALIFGGTAIMHFLAISVLSALVSGMGASYGLSVGLLVSLFLVLPAMTGTYLFAGRSLKLLAIDSGMYIVLFTISGLVLSIW